jgi:hypothetical protein
MQLELNWNFKLKCNTLNWIQIQLNRNGVQIFAKGIEILFLIMLLKKKLEKNQI